MTTCAHIFWLTDKFPVVLWHNTHPSHIYGLTVLTLFLRTQPKERIKGLWPLKTPDCLRHVERLSNSC